MPGLIGLRKMAMSLAMFGVVGLGSAVAARADSVILLPGGSATFTYQSVGFPGAHATATFSLSADGTTLTMVATNTSTDGTFLSGIGFNTTPNVTLVNSNATNGWSADEGSGGGLGGFELIGYGNGNNNRLAFGESATGTFVFSASFKCITIDLTVAHLTSLPNGNSEKPEGSITSTPEPASMLLLGTGLIGAAGLARRRLRK